ncbi:MAG: NifB/NifX family molybdenum-iron cluster-binding protein [Desulfobacteraceae bacterium]|nr:NifB/NifX family molybdenum-iron cluster-binding protein [Desulfobacteraceae bacterium]
MKLGLPGSGKEMDKLIDPRFGRCQYFIVIDPETFSFKAKENPFKSTDRGAGIQAAQWMADRRVKKVLSSRVGPNALKALKAAGITVITGVSGKIGEAVENYRAGKALNSSAKPNVVNAQSTASSNIGSRRGLGPRGECICTKCATSIAHRRGVPCRDEACPKCGARMRRERG